VTTDDFDEVLAATQDGAQWAVAVLWNELHGNGSGNAHAYGKTQRRGDSHLSLDASLAPAP
jgi:hypothetical protein